LIPPPPEGPDSPTAQPGPRIMQGPDADPFQRLRTLMETEWVPQMTRVLDIDEGARPIIWDADFLYGPRTAAGEDSFMLCEINVGSCFAVPDEAPAAIGASRERAAAPYVTRMSHRFDALQIRPWTGVIAAPGRPPGRVLN